VQKDNRVQETKSWVQENRVVKTKLQELLKDNSSNGYNNDTQMTTNIKNECDGKHIQSNGCLNYDGQHG
jgi:hypothetical protein